MKPRHLSDQHSKKPKPKTSKTDCIEKMDLDSEQVDSPLVLTSPVSYPNNNKNNLDNCDLMDDNEEIIRFINETTQNQNKIDEYITTLKQQLDILVNNNRMIALKGEALVQKLRMKSNKSQSVTKQHKELSSTENHENNSELVTDLNNHVELIKESQFELDRLELLAIMNNEVISNTDQPNLISQIENNHKKITHENKATNIQENKEIFQDETINPNKENNINIENQSASSTFLITNETNNKNPLNQSGLSSSFSNKILNEKITEDNETSKAQLVNSPKPLPSNKNRNITSDKLNIKKDVEEIKKLGLKLDNIQYPIRNCYVKLKEIKEEEIRKLLISYAKNPKKTHLNEKDKEDREIENLCNVNHIYNTRSKLKKNESSSTNVKNSKYNINSSDSDDEDDSDYSKTKSAKNGINSSSDESSSDYEFMADEDNDITSSFEKVNKQIEQDRNELKNLIENDEDIDNESNLSSISSDSDEEQKERKKKTEKNHKAQNPENHNKDQTTSTDPYAANKNMILNRFHVPNSSSSSEDEREAKSSKNKIEHVKKARTDKSTMQTKSPNKDLTFNEEKNDYDSNKENEVNDISTETKSIKKSKSNLIEVEVEDESEEKMDISENAKSNKDDSTLVDLNYDIENDESNKVEKENEDEYQEEDDENVSRKPNEKKKKLIIESDKDSEEGDTKSSTQRTSSRSSSISSVELTKNANKNKTNGKKRRRVKIESSSTSEIDADENPSDSNEDVVTPKNSKSYKKKNKPLKNDENEEDDDIVELIDEEEIQEMNKSVTRHKLRGLIDDKKLNKETLDAQEAERERKKRLEEKRKMEVSLLNSSMRKEENEHDVVLDYDPKTKEPLIKVERQLAKYMKPHQIEGVKFMWDNCYEKVEMIEKSKGSGCILAHCMGLGKTFQVITLVHTLLKHEELTKTKRVLILVPKNVQSNWLSECDKWTRDCEYEINIFDLPDSLRYSNVNVARLTEMEKWVNRGGIFVINYTMFNKFVTGAGQQKIPKKFVTKFHEYLTEKADLVVCDEGHYLKSEKTSLTKSVSKIKTQRRVVLTGTPLQNNLLEYYCMVSFVKPKLLGTSQEFKNRFANPINNGQHSDSTEADVRYMKKRAHVLHNTLDGCVQRKDYTVIKSLLPIKREYVLSIRLSEKQIELYRAYLMSNGIDNMSKIKGTKLFTDFSIISRIISHPWALKLNEARIQKKEEKESIKKFICDDEEEEMANDEDAATSTSEDTVKNDEIDDEVIVEEEIGNEATTSKMTVQVRRSKRVTINGGGINFNNNDGKDVGENSNDQPTETILRPKRWWSDIFPNDIDFDIEMSGKFYLLNQILRYCNSIGDKLLVFSQNLLSLDIIEQFLKHQTSEGLDIWTKGVDYFRMDGGTEINKRTSDVKKFNNRDNKRARLFLISTKAGGIGINLVGANRCVIFDANWNPSHDTQSIYRIYRFGQVKEVFIYRFLAQGTMEEKIYQRQVTKQSLSQRVLDEHQLDRHFTSQELGELYAFEPDMYDGNSDPNQHIMPDDYILKELLLTCGKWLLRYHEHDSLLENKLGEGLTEEERKAAWAEYEAEKQRDERTINLATENGDVGLPSTLGADLIASFSEFRNNALRYLQSEETLIRNNVTLSEDEKVRAIKDLRTRIEKEIRTRVHHLTQQRLAMEQQLAFNKNNNNFNHNQYQNFVNRNVQNINNIQNTYQNFHHQHQQNINRSLNHNYQSNFNNNNNNINTQITNQNIPNNMNTQTKNISNQQTSNNNNLLGMARLQNPSPTTSNNQQYLPNIIKDAQQEPNQLRTQTQPAQQQNFMN